MSTSTTRNVPIQGAEKDTEEVKSSTTKNIPIQEQGAQTAGNRKRAESDVEMGKETETTTKPSGTTAADQKDSDELLLWLARYQINRNHPRPTTGTIRVYKSGEVMTIQQDEKITKIFQKLITEGFLSAPVLDQQHRYTGYNLDLLDLVYFILDCFHEWRTGVSTAPTTAGTSTEPTPPTVDFWNAYFERDEFIRAHAMDVITRNPWRAYRHEHIAHDDFSTLYAMEVMARLGQHRVVIIDRNYVVQNILTQSMIISLISQNMKRLGSLRTTPISDLLAYLPAAVETVRESQLTCEAFNIMRREHVSGVGVVNEQGDLVDTLSVRDLRGVGTSAQHFMRLWLPVKKFKDQVREMYPRQTPARPLAVTPTDTFEKIVENMFDGNIHRVWIVNSQQSPKPIRVCTQRDVIRILLHKMGQALAPI